MRIITWNVNSLKSILPFRPWNELKNRTIEGMLDVMEAEIVCFQEHKMRRDQLTKHYVLPSPSYDSFFSFPSWKQGYSGTCTYVKNTYAVPIKAEDGITGLALEEKGANTNGPSEGSSSTGAGYMQGGGGATVAGWRPDERIGGYVADDEVCGGIRPELDGQDFVMKKLDMEGRAVVLDFGFFTIFNLYCPNETNDSRLPYKLNYLHYLQSRVSRLVALGRNVIVVGDMNVCHRPIDNGEGGIQRNADEHFDHPARKWYDAWVAPKGMMHDVTRDAWPERKGMFTCWNTKLDARPSNYGARIDYILVTPGLLPWIKHSDIQADVMGSDHCPVYVDLHEEITTEEGITLRLRDLMNASARPRLPPALEALVDQDREMREPPSFATKWWDEFSGKQRSLKDFFGKKGEAPPPPRLPRNKSSSQKPNPGPSAPVETACTSPLPSGPPLEVVLSVKSTPERANDRPVDSEVGQSLVALTKSMQSKTRKDPCIDLTADLAESSTMAWANSASKAETPKKGGKAKLVSKSSKDGQLKLSTFFGPPPTTVTKVSGRKGRVKSSTPDPVPLKSIRPPPTSPGPSRTPVLEMEGADYLFAVALAEQEEEMGGDAEAEEAAERDQAAVVSTWENIFAKKVPPKCRVHNLPCKPFTTKISGKNKGKKFWLCSKPVGEGWDNGKTKRPREEVNHQYRCDYFVWDHAVREREPLISDTVENEVPSLPNKRRKVKEWA